MEKKKRTNKPNYYIAFLVCYFTILSNEYSLTIIEFCSTNKLPLIMALVGGLTYPYSFIQINTIIFFYPHVNT